MNAITLETYRQRLLDRQQEIVRRIFELEENLNALTTEREIEYGDRAQAEMPEEALQQLDEQSRREVEAIQAALKRIEDGSYGRCEDCGHPIGAARLDAMPTARRCVACQEAWEQQARG